MTAKLPGEVGCLADMLEGQQVIRNRMLTSGNAEYLTRWVNGNAIGVKSVRAMTLNHIALETVAGWWCPQFPTMVTCVKINPLRDEVGLKEIPNPK